jgi:hypothetical protein
MSGDVIRIKTGVQMTSISQSTREDVIEVPRAEWDEMTPEEREERLDEIAQETLANEVNCWACVIEDEES